MKRKAIPILSLIALACVIGYGILPQFSKDPTPTPETEAPVRKEVKESPAPPPTQPSKVSEKPPPPIPYASSASIDEFREVAYISYTIDPRKEDLRLFNLRESGHAHTFQSIADWAQAEGKQPEFMMNGGMFRKDAAHKVYW